MSEDEIVAIANGREVKLDPVQVTAKGKAVLALPLGHDEDGNLAMNPHANWAKVGTVRPVQTWKWETEDGEHSGEESSREKAFHALLAAQGMEAKDSTATIPSLIDGL